VARQNSSRERRRCQGRCPRCRQGTPRGWSLWDSQGQFIVHFPRSVHERLRQSAAERFDPRHRIRVHADVHDLKRGVDYGLEVQDKSTDQQQGIDVSALPRLSQVPAQLIHRLRRLVGRQGEPGGTAAVRQWSADQIVPGFPPPSFPGHRGVELCMQRQHCIRRKRRIEIAGVCAVQESVVARHSRLRLIPRSCPPSSQRFESTTGHLDTLQTIRSLGAFEQCGQFQRFEGLRLLPQIHVQPSLASCHPRRQAEHVPGDQTQNAAIAERPHTRPLLEQLQLPPVRRIQLGRRLDLVVHSRLQMVDLDVDAGAVPGIEPLDGRLSQTFVNAARKVHDELPLAIPEASRVEFLGDDEGAVPRSVVVPAATD
jgi:hypothetical protein